MRSRQRGFLLNPFRFGVSGPTDPYFASVGLLLHYDGANGATTTVDSGPLAKAMTRTNGGAISTAQSLYGGSSWLDSTTSGQLFPVDGTGIISSGTTPWTWEESIYANSFSTAAVLFDTNNTSSNTTGWQVYVGSDGKLYVYSGTQAANYGGYGAGMSTANWYRLRVTWDGSVLRFFVNGTLLGTSATGFANVWGTQITIGNSSFSTQGFLGYRDEMRFTAGVCRSTANYTLDAAPFPNA